MSEEELVSYLRDDIESSYGERVTKAEARQADIAKSVCDDRKAMDGLGSPVAEIDQEIVTETKNRYGQDCFRDPDFMRWHQKRNPGSRVRSGGTRGVTITCGIEFPKK